MKQAPNHTTMTEPQRAPVFSSPWLALFSHLRGNPASRPSPHS